MVAGPKTECISDICTQVGIEINKFIMCQIGDDNFILEPGFDYLVAYWFARYYDVISSDL